VPGISTKVIRKHLREFESGMSAAVVAEDLDLAHAAVCTALKRMPDAYIASWRFIEGHWTALWRVVQVPEHAPKPLKGKL
jgi:hypothetical protein